MGNQKIHDFRGFSYFFKHSTCSYHFLHNIIIICWLLHEHQSSVFTQYVVYISSVIRRAFICKLRTTMTYKNCLYKPLFVWCLFSISLDLYPIILNTFAIKFAVVALLLLCAFAAEPDEALCYLHNGHGCAPYCKSNPNGFLCKEACRNNQQQCYCLKTTTTTTTSTPKAATNTTAAATTTTTTTAKIISYQRFEIQ